MERAPRLGYSMAIAAALHISALIGLWSALPPLSPPETQAIEVLAIELDLDPSAPSPAPSASSATAPPLIAPPPGLAAVARVERPAHATRDLGSRDPYENVVPDARPDARTDPGTGAATGTGAVTDPGASIGATAQAPAGSGSAAPNTPPVAPDLVTPPPLLPLAIHAPSAVLDAPLAQRGAASGAGASAQVMTAAHAIPDAKAPTTGRGTIKIETDANGLVLRVTTSNLAFGPYASELSAKLNGKRLRVPPGARGVLIQLAVDANTTAVPKLITGEATATPCRNPEYEKDQAGRNDVALNPACNNWQSFMPFSRHRVSVSVITEKAL